MKKTLIVFFLSAFIFAAKNGFTFSRPEDHVIIKGAVFSAVKNVPYEELRVYSLKKGKLEPMPFQIDKVDIDGKFLFSQKDADDKAKKRKKTYDDAMDDCGKYSKEKLEELKNTAAWTDNMKMFDDQDELVFMAWDLGEKAPADILPKGCKIEEIEILNPVDSDKGYAYLARFTENPPALSPVRYLTYYPKKDQIKTDFFMVKFEENNPFVFKEAREICSDGKYGKNYMDRVKMRFKIDIKWFVTLNFDENNANGELQEYKAGPIRVIKRTLFWLDILYIPVTPTIAMDFVFYTNGMISPSIMNVTYDGATTLNDGSYLFFGLDFSDVYLGSKVYTEKTAEDGLIDGKMSDSEKKMDLKNQNWYVVYDEGKSGAFTQLVFDKRVKNLKSDIWYIDDKNHIMKPEREPGSHLVGFYAEVKQFPKGIYSMDMYTYIHKKWKKGLEKRFLSFISHPLVARARIID